MKICHIISGNDTGGAGTHVLNLLKQLEKTEPVQLLTLQRGALTHRAEAMGIPTEAVSGLSPQRAEGFDILHCHGGRANLVGAALKHRVSTPIATTVHSDPGLDYLGRQLAGLTRGTVSRLAMYSLDWHICVSAELKRKLISHGCKADRVFTIFNGVDFSPAPNGAISEHNEDTVIFGIAARHTAVKDLETAIRGFAIAVKSRPDIRLMLAGEGEETKKLCRLSRRLCPEGTVVFPGWVEDKAEFYSRIDVNMLTSLSEGFPCAIVEGAQMGCATIATDVGGVGEMIKNGETGLLFRPGDTETLAGHMLRLAGDKNERLAMGERLQSLVLERFSTENMARRQLEIYRSIISRS